MTSNPRLTRTAGGGDRNSAIRLACSKDCLVAPRALGDNWCKPSQPLRQTAEAAEGIGRAQVGMEIRVIIGSVKTLTMPKAQPITAKTNSATRTRSALKTWLIPAKNSAVDRIVPAWP
jgi:hypothetical protein